MKEILDNNDSFNHSTWLTFMKNRLEIAKELLSKDGAIFISIDDNEQAHLKVLCDEIFLRDNFLCNIAYERSGVSGLGQGGQFLVNTHENILCYAKSKPDLKVVDFSGEGEFSYEDMKRYNKILLSAGKRKEVNRFIAPSTKEEVVIYKHEGVNIESISLKSFDKRKNEIYNQYLKNFEKIFRNTVIQEENEFQNKILSYCKDGFYSADYLVSRGKRKGEKITAYYIDGQVFAWLRDTAKIEDGKIIKTNKLSDFWSHEDIPKADLANEGGVKLRRGKKPEHLLRRLIKLLTNEGDWVLDFFLGSGTSAAVAHKMIRHYIGIEQLDYTNNDSFIRLKNVIGKENGKGKLHPVIENYDTTGVSKAVSWKGGGDFVYCELMKWNDKYIDEIKKAKTSEELIKIWNLMKETAFLSYKVDVEEFEKNVEEFEQLSLENQKKFLIECLDKNQLYVNLSEIDDEDYGVSKEDKELNKKFYGAL
jgi:adenine-specific DNA-methyltransferase